MRFESWWFLILLTLIPMLHRWWRERNRPAQVTFSLPVTAAASSRSPQRFLLLLRYAGLALFVAALARPQNSFTQTERTVSGVDILVTLDVSASMEIEDLGDRSRMEIAKETIEAFVKGRTNDRIGFVMFSGEAVTLAPPTLDAGLVFKQIREAGTGRLKDGTAIGDGLALAVSHLRESKAKSRVIVLLTDGENNVGQIDPLTAGELAKGYGIRVYTIAIGREGRVKLPIKAQGPFGKTITTYQWFDNQLNTELLQEISRLTGGKAYRVTEETALHSVFAEIDRLEKTEIKSRDHVRYTEIFGKPLRWGAILVTAEQILARTWWRILP